MDLFSIALFGDAGFGGPLFNFTLTRALQLCSIAHDDVV